MLFNPMGRLNEIDAIVVMFFNPGSYGENIWIKNNIFCRETDLLGQYAVSPLTNFGLARKGIGLTFFFKGHNNNRCAIAATKVGMFNEFFLTFFQTDGIHHAFALNTLQA